MSRRRAVLRAALDGDDLRCGSCQRGLSARILSRTAITSDPPGVLPWLVETGIIDASDRILVLNAEWRLRAAEGTYMMGIRRGGVKHRRHGPYVPTTWPVRLKCPSCGDVQAVDESHGIGPPDVQGALIPD